MGFFSELQVLCKKENLVGLVEMVVTNIKLVFGPHMPAPSLGSCLGRHSTVHGSHETPGTPPPPSSFPGP